MCSLGGLTRYRCKTVVRWWAPPKLDSCVLASTLKLQPFSSESINCSIALAILLRLSFRQSQNLSTLRRIYW